MHLGRLTAGRMFLLAIVLGALVLLNQATAEAVTARAAKDSAERGKAITMSTRYLQGPGFMDPMLTAENVNDSLVTVELDSKSWGQMDKNQKNDFLERVNARSLNANGGVSIDIQVSVNGAKVASSLFSGGQQFLRLQ